MTMIIVALLHGRTKEEWYEWIKHRVENDYGYKTPISPPELYSKGQREEFERRKQEKKDETQASGNWEWSD